MIVFMLGLTKQTQLASVENKTGKQTVGLCYINRRRKLLKYVRKRLLDSAHVVEFRSYLHFRKKSAFDTAADYKTVNSKAFTILYRCHNDTFLCHFSLTKKL
ncbi:hypothetical protein ATANTOWER_015638 [Ataeniobius toweri]|uniref:Uncharacterized protein n=1 Tax=Ataeniobius toweri TaxID=208326 RepID=A0ABU7BGW3_9TELE|nr:hypothetical protein [Ataeniobius toweri]